MKFKEISVLFSLVLFIALFIVKANEPKLIDWKNSFSKYDKIPYGSYLLFKLLPDIFNKATIITTNKTFYEQIKENENLSGSYIYINSSTEFDTLDVNYLLSFISKGNNVFIASENNNYLSDSLKFELSHFDFNTDSLYIISDTLTKNKPNLLAYDSIGLNLIHKNLHQDTAYFFKKNNATCFFEKFDTSNTTILGFNTLNRVNFIKITIGTGNLYLHACPIVFTNYNLLYKNNSNYISQVLSHLPNSDNIYWDEYFKSNKKVNESPLRYIFQTEPLKWSFYLGLVGIILFIIFEAKRKQRIIPIIEPLENTTLKFVQTIGLLYFQKHDNKNLAEKKISYWHNFIRQNFYINTAVINAEAAKLLSLKSGVELNEINNLLGKINFVQNEIDITDDELFSLCKSINNFYQLTKK